MSTPHLALKTSLQRTCLAWALVLSACSSVPTGPAVPDAARSGGLPTAEMPVDAPPVYSAAPVQGRPVAAGSATGSTTAASTAADMAPSRSAASPAENVDTVQDPAPAQQRPATTTSLRTLAGAEEDTPGDRSDLWERVRRGFGMPDLDSDLVRRWEQWYATRPDYVQRMTERGGLYLFHVVEEVHKRDLPMELALLPFIESAFNPQALSVASASGMWQFMPATGRQFELKQNLFRDDRRDVLASTRAALDYLQMLHRMFGDWHLALAAYNWGQGNVQRAIERNRRAREDTVYTALRMPDETRNYVPKLQAVKNIITNPAAFALALPPLENHPFFLTVSIERDIDVDLVARLAGVSVDEFRALNPQLNKPVLLAAGTPQVLLPYDNANRFVRELAGHQGPLASLTAWVAPRTLRLAEAAKLTSVPESRLRELNKIPDRMLIKAGSALIVPRRPDHSQDVAEQVADQATMQLTPDGPKMVRRTVKAHAKGESLASFARRHGVDAEDLARWNKLPVQTSLRPGQSMTLMSAAQARGPRKPPGKPAAKTSARKAPDSRPVTGKTSGRTEKSAQRR